MISEVLSPTPPVECLSAFGASMSEKSMIDPDSSIAIVTEYCSRRFSPRRITTHSLSMRARSGTLRFIETYHDPDRSTLVPAARVFSD